MQYPLGNTGPSAIEGCFVLLDQSQKPKTHLAEILLLDSEVGRDMTEDINSRTFLQSATVGPVPKPVISFSFFTKGKLKRHKYMSNTEKCRLALTNS